MFGFYHRARDLVKEFFKDYAFGTKQQREFYMHRQRHHWANWISQESFYDEEPLPEHLKQLDTPSDLLKIGILPRGGIGDMIYGHRLALAVKKKYPDSKIFMFCENAFNAGVFDNSPILDGIFSLPPWAWRRYFIRLLRTDKLDMLLETRYLTKAQYGRHSKIPAKDRLEMNQRFNKFDPQLYHRWPYENNTLSRFCKEHNYSEFDLIEYTSAVKDLKNCRSVFLPSDEDVETIERKLANAGPYMTIHHGAGPVRYKLPDGTSTLKNVQVKNWSVDRWGKVVAYLNSRGYKVFQLGLLSEERIPGADYSLIGDLTFNQSACAIKGSMLHLDTEGGLMHLARDLGVRSLILFGATPIFFFGYPENINIQEGACMECWWSTPIWNACCPKLSPKNVSTYQPLLADLPPMCMKAITPERVIKALEGALATLKPYATVVRKVAFFGKADFSDENIKLLQEIYKSAGLVFTGQLSTDTEEPTHGMYVHGPRHWEYPFVVRNLLSHPQACAGSTLPRLLDIGGGRSAFAPYIAQSGLAEATVVDLDYKEYATNLPRCQNAFLRYKHPRLRVDFGSAYNLPYFDNTFDYIVSLSVYDRLKYKDSAIREALRVLKPGGKLILTFQVGLDEIKDAAVLTLNCYRDLLSNLSQVFDQAAFELSCGEIVSVGYKIPAGCTVAGIVLEKTVASDDLAQNWKHHMLFKNGSVSSALAV